MIDDPLVPLETIIRYSKRKTIFSILLVLAFAGLGSFTFLPVLIADNKGFGFYWVLTIVIIFPSVFLISLIRRIVDKIPPIIIDNKGIKVNIPPYDLYLGKQKPKYFAWQDIGNEYVDERKRGRHYAFFLTFLCDEGEQVFPISGLDINQDDLNYLLEVYRKRSGKKFYYQE